MATLLDISQYLKTLKNYLVDTWELDPDFAEKAAQLVYYCLAYRLRPEITSGYRSPERQAELVAAWNSGNPNVHTPLPPGKSLHNNTTWYGKPAALALDMVTSSPSLAGRIAAALGLVWGGENDYVHFALRRGTL